MSRHAIIILRIGTVPSRIGSMMPMMKKPAEQRRDAHLVLDEREGGERAEHDREHDRSSP